MKYRPSLIVALGALALAGVALFTVISLAACGGRSTGPSAMVGVTRITLLNANPPPGSTLTVVSLGNATPFVQLSMTFSLVPNHDIKFPEATVYFGSSLLGAGDGLAPGGWPCATAYPAGVGQNGTLKANQTYTLMVQQLYWDTHAPSSSSQLPMTTSKILVIVKPHFDGGIGLSCAEDFDCTYLNVSYSFVASASP